MSVLTKTKGRPVELGYSDDVLDCQLNCEVPIRLKRALAARAERNQRALKDEVRLALTSWAERPSGQAA